ncbi:MAG TPA: flagellar protein FliT [Burkholderiaceae bacterium]|nr:flagellar protein FliT [Burkholderiaceae bacterium]
MPNEFCEVAEMIEPASSTTAAEPSRSSLLQHYEAIAQSSCAMLAAARAGDWIEVERQEERCGALIAILKASDEPCSSLNAADDQRRMLLLRQILADDAGVRAQAEPWLEPIVPLISTSRLKLNNGSE